ncbi:F-box domain protein [Ophiocordyceps camponoti-floridani]|uniref:F-box domain protein n=1 Tax=Ophiocordyceps camponoti-floridani TaxID=2030778 RepID=A0A8H4QBN5_9HYPO|nr:F-box domain protein [Ophiocordyceps camponoti-floridani]
MESGGEGAARWPSSVSKPASALERLPDEIIEQILLATDPNGFASLVLVNSRWRAVSQRPHLYLYHLERCPCHGSSSRDVDLSRLRRLFARQVKRNLFDAYLRPRCTVVKLISNSISSSSCPGGEGMQFAPSLRGHHLLAYNSSRIYLLDVRGPHLEVRRELKMLRRPASACVTDDATLLAVLSTEVQIDVYDLNRVPPRRKHSLLLNSCPRTMALSSCGSVLVAAYDGGIDVSSLDPGALSTERRSVKCDAVDALTFSLDGTQILGTTTHSSSPSTVVLTAPYYDPTSQLMDSNLSAMWTTSILFPSTSRDCSHAILLPRDGHHGEAEWTFTYDGSFETFRAVRLDDLRNGTTHFTGPMPRPDSQHKLLPCTLPSSTLAGDLVAAGFRGSDVWVYGVPGDLDAVSDPSGPHDGPSNPSPGPARQSAGLSRHASSRGQDTDGERVPQWQLLCDRLRNNLVAGCKVAELAGVSNVKWVGDFAGASGASRERLVVAARGVSGPRLATDEEDVEFMDGGRVALLDFEYGLVDGQTAEIIIEVGTDEPEVLEEEKRDIATEVALVRRRTRTGGPSSSSRPARTRNGAGTLPDGLDALPMVDDDGDVVRGRRSSSKGAAIIMADGCHQGSMEEQEALDAPYAHASPRSGSTLRRAATAAAANRRLNPCTADGRRIEYRRADGRAEHPHESDADDWVPPPPPYQKEDPGGDLPAFLRGPAVAPPPTPPPPSFREAEPDMSPVAVQRRFSLARIPSESSHAQEGPGSSPPVDLDDLYDVSPPVSPCLSDGQPYNQDVAAARAASASWTSASASPPVRAQPSPLSDRASMSSGCSLALAYSALAYMDAPESPPPSQCAGLVAAEPAQRRLSNSQTWPTLASTSNPLGGHERRPLTALHSRQTSHGTWADVEQGDGAAGFHMSDRAVDGPLIISTPTGVSGGLNLPGRRRSSRLNSRRILAPVPRRPGRQMALTEAAEETSEETADEAEAPEQRRFKATLPVWLMIGSGRSAAGVSRRPSRAERSAAKNMLDARRRGWTGEAKNTKKKKKKKKKNKKKNKQTKKEASTQTETEGSNSEWTDGSGPSMGRERERNKPWDKISARIYKRLAGNE